VRRVPHLPSVAELPVGYFAASMAVGVNAIAAEQLGLHGLAVGLWIAAAVAFVVLAALVTVRAVRWTASLVADLTHHATAFSALTAVVAVNLLGVGATTVLDARWLSRLCWIVGIVGWIALTYTALMATIVRRPTPDLTAAINGTWFLLSAATESVVALTVVVAAGRVPSDAEVLVAVGGFGLGVVLYLIVATLVFLRWTLRSADPEELGPPSWIAAGAAAVIVLAGSKLLDSATTSPYLERLAPFVEGMVLTAWATATFWLPVMLAIGVWRRCVHRIPFRYEPELWSMLFPIGTYGAATFAMANATGLHVLDPVPPIFLTVALLGVAVTTGGLIRSLLVAQPAGESTSPDAVTPPERPSST